MLINIEYLLNIIQQRMNKRATGDSQNDLFLLINVGEQYVHREGDVQTRMKQMR